MTATTTDSPNSEIGAQNVDIAIVSSRSLSQSPGDSFFELRVVENPGFAIGISTLSVVVPEINYFRFCHIANRPIRVMFGSR